MIAMLFKLAGGVGLFVLGMILLTDGLKSFAGQSLQKALIRFTGTPFKAFGSGAIVTVMVQSSSATTVTVIGFVSAGLLTFAQAVGVVLGASFGTTGTGWIVSVLGLKVSVGFYALPLVGIGAFIKLLAHGRWKSLGMALAGFGLIFVGIESLQDGMRGISGMFNLAQLPSIGIWGHLLAMVIGAVMTVVMQSSSAAVATALTALHTGTVNFDQAASIVIGAAVGTTVTGALAAIGASIPAKRTALAHVLFNLATGLIAILLLPILLWVIELMQVHLGLEPGAVSLAAFHTFFIAMGVAIFLPFVNSFSRFIEGLLPDKGPVLTRHLDDSLLHAPMVALEATRRVLVKVAMILITGISSAILNRPYSLDKSLALSREALEKTQHFFSRIPSVSEEQPMSRARISQMHAIDHLMRLTTHFYPPDRIRKVMSAEALQPAVRLSRDIMDLALSGLRGEENRDWSGQIEQKARALAELRRKERPAVLDQTVHGQQDPTAALDLLDAMRWLDRVCYHVWRICNYLGRENEGDNNGHAIPDQEHSL
ncbi:Na/Pi cotransporter family protein [Desulfonatronovibrio hydrogenovorans]|uniref:Na/Pi cotransporter family protein n=1 Tax=Desulfonatronovibrio hydrogenovorans TaxID=53245 RepID=UPI00068E9BD1|nr:Na/Pi symporter [Desulfonatronovibrio hydrogenovorans]